MQCDISTNSFTKTKALLKTSYKIRLGVYITIQYYPLNFFFINNLANSYPKGREGCGQITVTLFDSVNFRAISNDTFAEITGSGGYTEETTNIFFIA